MSYRKMQARLGHLGGPVHQGRFIKTKQRSLEYAIANSYQSAEFSFVETPNESFTGLFNPMTLTEDKETKIISTPFDSDVAVGSIIRWHNRDSLWLVYLEEKTELAYFKGRCRACHYTTSWIDNQKRKQTAYLAVVGTEKRSMRNINKKIATDSADLSGIVVLTSATPANNVFFREYQYFSIKGITYRVEGIDRLSMPGILELFIREVFTNTVEDDAVENIRNKWNVLPNIPNYKKTAKIIGPKSIKPQVPITYKADTDVDDGRWAVAEPNLPLKISGDVGKEVKLIWTGLRSGQFTLQYFEGGEVSSQTVIVESLY